MAKASKTIRLEKGLIEKIDKLVVELQEKGQQPNVTFSDLVRQSLERWIGVYKSIEEGETLIIAKTRRLKAEDLKEIFEGLKKERDASDNELIKVFYNHIINELEFNIDRILDVTKEIQREELKKVIKEAGEIVKDLESKE